MPKTYPKTQPKKTKPKKPKFKTQPKPVSITTRKSYWITLTLIMVVFTFVYGYLMNISLERIVMILGTILLLIGFAFYLGFKPSTTTSTKEQLFIFVGASIIGFSIWAVIVLSFNAMDLTRKLQVR